MSDSEISKPAVHTIHALLWALVAVLFADSQQANAAPVTSSERHMRAYPLNEPPQLDGMILNDGAWSGVDPTSNFWQLRPYEGRPASQRTDVFIGYTEVALYIGVVAYDEDPSRIIVAGSRRDAELDNTDSFRFMLDSFYDQQNAFVFGTNAAGVEYDGQVTKEADYAAGGSFNLTWDAIWTVKTRVSELGWSAEFEIPWRSLRYDSKQKQTWGINFQRNIGRNNEVAYWSPLSRQYDLYRISDGGIINGLRVPAQRNLKITPYILATAFGGGNLPAGTRTKREVGLDIKYSLTSGLTLDATYNTDFAQVEVDEQKINLDRFSIFLTEKRPFFLENYGIFSVGNTQDVELFFSRRIGIAKDGSRIPISGGLRLSGRMGSSTNVGLLQIKSAAVDGVAPANVYTVARVRQDLPNRSSIGALFVNRNGDGNRPARQADDVNRTYAVDASWGINDNLSLDGWIARTYSPGLTGRDKAFALKSNYSSVAWLAKLNYTEVGAAFNPDVGFLARSGYRRGQAHLMRRFHPDTMGLYELRSHVSYTGYWNFAGFHESGLLRYDIQAEWPNGLQLRTGIRNTHEGVMDPFDIVSGVTVRPGIYDDRQIEFRIITNESARLSADVATRVGSLFGGDSLHITPSLQYRFADSFSSELAIDYNDIKMPVRNGNFNVTLTRLKLSYTFTPKIALQALIQHNNRTNFMATNLRFSWLTSANAGFYMVYSEVKDGMLAHSPPGREIIVKFSKIFDLLH